MAYDARSLAVVASVAALLCNACLIVGPADDDGTSDTSITSGYGGSGGNGGSAADGGAGGEDIYCIDAEGSGETELACDALAITPTSQGGPAPLCNVDGQMLEPLGYVSCVSGFGIFNPGHAEDFTACLRSIATEDACNDEAVFACAESMYQDACGREDVDELCNDIATQCSAGGEPFDEQGCAAELPPINDPSINSMVECMNVTDDTCQARFDICLDELMTVD